ncbi:hypothetical protein BPOR_0175g00160 [Botrytis porri]|uniref:Uncharacterized protein n=1 Tax=Botrytis porri TaxID=87229 RepID=A0A4Z1KUN5_9HELO|nr:hypothetical protein BPOR_0175g00160 [Botrytis porri]
MGSTMTIEQIANETRLGNQELKILHRALQPFFVRFGVAESKCMGNNTSPTRSIRVQSANHAVESKTMLFVVGSENNRENNKNGLDVNVPFFIFLHDPTHSHAIGWRIPPLKDKRPE